MKRSSKRSSPFGRPLSTRQIRRMTKIDKDGVPRINAGHLSSGAVRGAFRSQPLAQPCHPEADDV